MGVGDTEAIYGLYSKAGASESHPFSDYLFIQKVFVTQPEPNRDARNLNLALTLSRIFETANPEHSICCLILQSQYNLVDKYIIQVFCS